MVWTNILVPVLGITSDAQPLSVAKALAAPFDATISVVFGSPSASGLFNWANEGGFGVTDVAVAAIQEETERGRARCGELLAALDYPKTSFEAVTADDWLGLRTATRLVDVVVWERSAAGGHGFFCERIPADSARRTSASIHRRQTTRRRRGDSGGMGRWTRSLSSSPAVGPAAQKG